MSKYKVCNVYENATLIPSWHNDVMHYFECAYTKEKEYIPFSSSRPIEYYVIAPFIEAKQKIEHECILGGHYILHIGHFFVETLPRLWFAKENPHLPIVWTCPKPHNIPKYHNEIFDLLEIKNEFIFLDAPTIINKLHIPCQLLRAFSSYYTDDWNKFLGVYKGEVVPGKKVFISRAMIEGRGYINEAEITQYALDNGYEILIPEHVSIEEELKIVSSAEEILMIEASSFFPLLLVENLSAKIKILRRMIDPIFAMIYSNIEYINAHEKDIMDTFWGCDRILEVDIEDLDYALKNNIYHDTGKGFKASPYDFYVPGYRKPDDAIEREKNFNYIAYPFFDYMCLAGFAENREDKVNFYKKSLRDFNKTKEIESRKIFDYYAMLRTIYSIPLDEELTELVIELVLNYDLSFPLSFTYFQNYIALIQEHLSLETLNTLYKKSLDYLEKENKDMPNCLHSALAHYQATNQGKEANQVLQKILAFECKNSFFLYAQYRLPLIQIFLNVQNFNHALNILIEGLKLKKDWLDGYINLAKIYELLGKTDYAIKAIEQAFVLGSTHDTYKEYYANLLIKKRQEDNACVEFFKQFN